jgi:hypothetical protein
VCVCVFLCVCVCFVSEIGGLNYICRSASNNHRRACEECCAAELLLFTYFFSLRDSTRVAMLCSALNFELPF